jgi:hypothetical protein
MKQTILFVTVSILAVFILSLSGCVDQTTNPVSTQPQSLQPRGTISGKILDRCTGKAINGAVITVAFDGKNWSTTSDASGSFSFANVPAGKYQTIDSRNVPTGDYLLTESLVDYNKKVADTTQRYRDFHYDPVTITFTSLVPGDSLGVSGLVGAVVCTLSTLSTTLSGTVVDKDMLPVASANITIRDHFTGYVLAITSSAADGSFRVPALENGMTFDIVAKSADGAIQGSVLAFATPCNLPSDSLRAQVKVEKIQLLAVDDVEPYIISVTTTGGAILENNADVQVQAGGTLPIIYTFSEPIKQTPYTTLGAGYHGLVDNIHIIYNGLKKSALELPSPTIAWNANGTVLTVTASGLVGSARYTVAIDSDNVKANLTDLVGNPLVNNDRLIGDIEGLNFTTAGGSAAPAAPVVARRIMPGTTIAPLDFSGGSVLLEWAYDPAVRSYNVYKSVNGGSFDTLATNVLRTQYADVSGSLIRGTLNDPLGPGNVSYEVTAVSADLAESTPSNVITVRDSVKPQLIYSPAPAAAPGTNNWIYILGFSEPMSQSTIETASNYTFGNGGGVTYTINSIVYAGYDGTQWVAYLYVTSSAVPVAGYDIVVNAAITDLAGNGVDNAANTTPAY